MPRPKSTLGAIVELVVDRRLRDRPGPADPGFRRQAVPDPDGVDDPDARDRPAGSRPAGLATTSAIRRSATSSSSTRRRGAATGDLRSPTAATEPAAVPTPRSPSRPTTNFIKRVVATPGDELYIEDGHAIVNGEPIEDDFIKPCEARMGCNFPKPITIPRGPLLHDGRQSRIQRRQPLLGPGPARLDHRQGVRHLLAARPHRDLLERPPTADRRGPPRRPPHDLAVPLRPAVRPPLRRRGRRGRAAGRWRARWSRPASCSTTSASARPSARPWPASTTPSARPRRSASGSTRR